LTVEYEHSRGVAFCERLLGNQIGRQIIIKLGEEHLIYAGCSRWNTAVSCAPNKRIKLET